MQGIYKITNIKNQKCYIGQSKDLESRKKTHFRDLSEGKHHSHEFQEDFDKYGIDSFEFEILEIINDADLLSFCERYYIDKFNTVLDGYNISYPKCFYDKKSFDKKEISMNDINYLQANFPFVHIAKDLLQDIDDGLVVEGFSNSFSLLINFFKVVKKRFNEISIEIKYKKLKSSKKRILINVNYFHDMCVTYLLMKNNQLSMEYGTGDAFPNLTEYQKEIVKNRIIRLSDLYYSWLN